MFGIFKRKSKLTTEEDFDVLDSVTRTEIEIPKHELIRIFLKWTEQTGPLHMNSGTMCNIVYRDSFAFNQRLKEYDSPTRRHLARAVGNGLIRHFKDLGLVRGTEGSGKGVRITDKGEQIRQFYVLKLGGRGTVSDRMHFFKVKPA